MLRPIKESDWEIFRQLQQIALERFCQRILDEVDQAASEPDKTSHERYLAVCKLIERRDKEVADAFNDYRRSRALWQLAHLMGHELLTEEEFSRFSDETREIVQFLLGRGQT